MLVWYLILWPSKYVSKYAFCPTIFPKNDISFITTFWIWLYLIIVSPFVGDNKGGLPSFFAVFSLEHFSEITRQNIKCASSRHVTEPFKKKFLNPDPSRDLDHLQKFMGFNVGQNHFWLCFFCMYLHIIHLSKQVYHKHKETSRFSHSRTQVTVLQQSLARMLFWGQQGVSPNVQEAVRHYKRGAVQWKDPVSMYDYGIVLLQVRVTSDAQWAALEHAAWFHLLNETPHLGHEVLLILIYSCVGTRGRTRHSQSYHFPQQSHGPGFVWLHTNHITSLLSVLLTLTPVPLLQ